MFYSVILGISRLNLKIIMNTVVNSVNANKKLTQAKCRPTELTPHTMKEECDSGEKNKRVSIL